MLIKGQAELSSVYHASNRNWDFLELYTEEADLWSVERKNSTYCTLYLNSLF